MATREENLKKINAELEKLSDEELDNVAGSGNIESSNDTRFLNVLNGSIDRYEPPKVWWSVDERDIAKAWATVGIDAKIDTDLWYSNKYYIKGTKQELTQEQARQYAMNYVGKQLKESDWYW